MTDVLTVLEDLHAKGAADAHVHFMAFRDCVRGVLPECLCSDMPATHEEMTGLFTASTKSCYISIFDGIDGYAQMTANFKCDGGWQLDDFSLNGGMFAPTFRCKTLEDAVVMSRKVAKIRAKGELENVLAEANPVLQ